MKNFFIGGVVAVALIIGGLFYITQNTNLLSGTATSTPSVSETGGDTFDQGRESGAPVVTTSSNVAPTDETAVVVGTVTPNGDLTSYWYEYGTSSDLGSNTSKQNIGSGFAAIPATGYITGLSKKTTYHFRLTAENQYGTVSGSQYTFQTTEGISPPIGGIPTVKSVAAGEVSRNAAVLRGEVMPNKAATQYWFEYGKTANLGNITDLTGVGNGSMKVPVAVSLSDLDSATTYYFRLNAQNQFGTVNGATLNFKTVGPAAATAPDVATRDVTNVGTSTATLRGTVDANSAETTYWFEYSTDSLLGSVLLKTTEHVSIGAGSNQMSVEADVSGLGPKTTYYFRIVAQNSIGVARGNSETFKTK